MSNLPAENTKNKIENEEWTQNNETDEVYPWPPAAQRVINLNIKTTMDDSSTHISADAARPRSHRLIRVVTTAIQSVVYLQAYSTYNYDRISVTD